MNIRNTISTILLTGTLSLVPSCQKAEKQVMREAAERTATVLNKDTKLLQLAKDTFSTTFSDKDKIIEYNRLLQAYEHPADNYIIIDKKKCRAFVYTPNGDKVYDEEIALGKHYGDKRAGGYKHPERPQSYTTPPGEYYIGKIGSRKGSNNEILYGNRLLYLIGDHTRKDSRRSQNLALHQIPNSKTGRLRVFVYNNLTLKDNRVSYGCVNFLENSFDKLMTFIKGIRTKVYILPEEKGNSLHLEKQKDGTFKFFQTKYRTEAQELNK